MRRKLYLSIMVCALAAALSVAPTAAEMEEVTLSLDECLRMALANNLDLVSARFSPELARQDINLQDSVFDLGFQSAYSRSKSTRPAFSAFDLNESEVDNLTFGAVQQNLKSGADWSVSLGTSKATQSGALVNSSESYTSALSFNVNFPILRGFGTEVNTESLVLARNNVDVSVWDLEAQAEQTLEQVEGAYWNVVAAREGLRIAELSLTRARDLLDLNRKKVEVGTLAPIEITQAEAGVASQEESVILAEQTLRDAEDELRRLLAIPSGDPMWTKAILNADQPEFKPKSVDLDAAIAKALDERTELSSARQVVRNSELSERVSKRQNRHQLDANAGYGISGASPELVDPDGIPENGDEFFTAPSFSDSFTNIADRDFDNWTVGLTYRVPFGNRAAKATYARSRLSRERAEVNLRSQEQNIEVEVRGAVRAVESGVKRVEAARVNVRLQTENLNAEQKKFENGMSTSFQVLEFQEDLANAELSAVRAMLDYFRALTALERSQGTLLEAHGLVLGE